MSHKAARTHPKYASGWDESEMPNPWASVDQPIALSTMMRPRGFVFFTSPTVSRASRELLDFVSLSSTKVGLLDMLSDDSAREATNLTHPSGTRPGSVNMHKQ